MSNRIIGGLTMLILLLGLIRGVPVYEAFVRGARKGLQTAMEILPSLAAMLIAIAAMTQSGLMDALMELLSPLWLGMGIPKEAAPLMLMRPISGSGALAMLSQILTKYGPDSAPGRVASVLMGSSETILYTMSLYLARARVQRSRYALPAALAAWLAGSWAAGLLCR